MTSPQLGVKLVVKFGCAPACAVEVAVNRLATPKGTGSLVTGVGLVVGSLVEALAAGIVEGKLAALVLLAEAVARDEENNVRVFGELLGDAALLAAGVSPELVRHRAVTGGLS